MINRFTKFLAVAVLFGLAAAFTFGPDSLTAESRLAVPKPAAPTKPKKKEDKASKFMRGKLTSSQKVLEGLVTEDFKLIEKGAKDMQRMSQAASWFAVKGPVYRQFSAEFRRTCEKLVENAQDKNLDGASLNYMQLTMTCFNCHKYTRGIKVVDASDLRLEPREPL